MNDMSEMCMTVNSEVLVRGFLKVLNQECLISNKTYLEAINKLEKGDVKKDVD